jgi:type IV pilus assembly protein PilC
VINIIYAYAAYNERREVVKGKLEAKNEDQASELLNYAGYQLINLKAIATFPTFDRLMLQISPVKPADIILFYRQMALLVDSGLNIVTALELLEEQTTRRMFKNILAEIISDVRAGNQLSASMSKHPEIFPPVHCQSLKVGEQTGGLEVILRQMADHLEKQLNASKGVKNAMTYPVLASIVAVIVIAILVVFVLPVFKGLYTTMNVKTPMLVEMMLNLGDQLRIYGVYILGALAVAIISGWAYIRTTRGRYNWDKLGLKFPLVGRINHLNELARLCRNVAVLFKSGLPLTEILPLAVKSSGNKVMTEALVSIRDDMLGGEGLSRPMMKHSIFLPMMIQMVRVGEETGNLDTTLLSVAQSFEAEADDRTKGMIALIQPVMTIAIALVVGVVALSLVSAMYSMYGQF